MGAGFRALDLIPADVPALEALPAPHGDPFDRIRR
jgi:PIN domain nuclease of toxin-antitoxin system